jgi:hypothetical protein
MLSFLKMRYPITNLGQMECTGDVCRRVVTPAPGYVAPARSLMRKDAFNLANTLATVIETNPSCFEGEDLSVAYALEQKLRSYGSPVPEGMAVPAVMLDLSEEEARVAGRAETCGQIPTIRPAVPGGQPTPSTGPLPAGTRLPEGPSQFPIVPVAIGAGALGLIALIVSLAK